MRLSLKPTILPKLAILPPLNINRTAVPIDASQIVTFHPEFTGRHPAHVFERLQFILVWVVVVIVRTGVIGAVLTQEVYVAQFHLLDAFDFVGIVLDD